MPSEELDITTAVQNIINYQHALLVEAKAQTKHLKGIYNIGMLWVFLLIVGFCLGVAMGILG
jgi:hypothetical protein